jgi:peptide deformylase
MALELVYYGNPLLRAVAEPYAEFTPALSRLAEEMVDAMHRERGIGLAGPQIGQGKRIFVMEIPVDMDKDEETGERLNPELKGPLVVINPEILDPSDEEDVYEEGCLSIPGVNGNVTRPFAVRLRFQDLQGKPQELNLRGLAARCAQHENDHLNGKLFIDYLSPVKRLAIKGKLRRIKDGDVS